VSSNTFNKIPSINEQLEILQIIFLILFSDVKHSQPARKLQESLRTATMYILR